MSDRAIHEVDISPPDFRDPAKMLRNIADQVDAGDYGSVDTLVVALAGENGMETMGGGKLADFRFCAFLFAAAAARLHNIPWEQPQ